MKKNVIFPGLLAAVLSGALLLFLFSAPAQAKGWHIYLGQLHSHSGNLDQIGPVEEVYDAAKAAGMDFFAVTDYSHSFENRDSGAISADGTALSATWKAGKEAAEAASSETFTAIYGYEMAWRRDLRLGHIVTFATPGWQCRGQQEVSDLESYYQALASVPSSIGMFCHPGEHYGDFEAFGHYQWDYGRQMALVEVSGEDGALFFQGYQDALDAGWHVAPAASGASHEGNWEDSPVRTGILAADNAEESLYEAIRSRRVYASLDPDLKIRYSLGGHILGSQVTGLASYQAEFSLSETSGTLQIVTTGAEVVASCPATETSLPVPAGYPYYYLRLVRDGQTVAVTAPVWVETPTDFGAGELTASAAVPVQNEPMAFSFSLFNHEAIGLTLERIQLWVDGSLIWQDSLVLPGGGERSFRVPYTHSGVGVTDCILSASGTISGQAVSFEKRLTLSFRPEAINAHILVDGRHSDVVCGDLENLTALAEKADMDVAIFRDALPEGGDILIVPPSDWDFSEDYPQFLQAFVENGGQLILCGQAGNNDRINELLRALGSTMEANNDTARDPVNNGGTPESLYPDVFHTEHWDLTGSEYYSQQNGCTIDPGAGTWLVKGMATMEGESRVLLAKEQIGKGTVYLAGSFFLDDSHMPLPDNQWDTPRANQLLLESLLNIQRSQLEVTQIKAVRSGAVGSVCRVKGYVTAGTSDPSNRFPGLIYIQDGTGGIEITSFDLPDMEVGMHLDITGQLVMDGQNPALKLITCAVIPNSLYRIVPDRLFHAASMNYARHGGELMKVEGIVKDIEYTPDGLGVRRFLLMDPLGVPAEILVEDYILSGAYGVNHLAEEFSEGDTVRAFGILHLEDNGNPVLRVRNCDEVVNIPPVPEPEEKTGNVNLSNPKTGDAFFTFYYFWSTMFKKE